MRPHDDRGGVTDVHGPSRTALSNRDDDLARPDHLLAQSGGLRSENKAGALRQYRALERDGPLDIVDADQCQALTRAMLNEFAHLEAVIHRKVTVGDHRAPATSPRAPMAFAVRTIDPILKS